MKHLTSLVAATALMAFAAPAHAQFFGPGLDNSTVLGGLTGAGIGGALGSNIAGSGNRDEGTAIGAVVGGLAGAAYGNSRSSYGANPYAGQFNPGFNTRSLLGTAAGAGIGGVIGSNLAGSGVQEEGTAIGALIGGVAGYALSDRSGAFRGGNSGYGFNAPAYRGASHGHAGAYHTGYNTGYSYGYAPAPARVYAPAPVYAPTTTSFGGYFPAGGYANSHVNYVQPARTVRPVMMAPAPVSRPITYAAPSLSLAPSSLPVVASTSSHYYSNANLRQGETVVGYSSGCYSRC